MLVRFRPQVQEVPRQGPRVIRDCHLELNRGDELRFFYASGMGGDYSSGMSMVGIESMLGSEPGISYLRPSRISVGATPSSRQAERRSATSNA